MCRQTDSIGESLSGTFSCKFTTNDNDESENTRTHYLLSYYYRLQSLEQVFILFISRWITKRKRNRVGKYRSKEENGGFMDINQRKLELLPLNLNRCTCKMARNLSLSAVGETEKEFVVDVENLKSINKITPIAVNSNSFQVPSISGVVSRKMKRDSVSKSTMINLQAQG